MSLYFDSSAFSPLFIPDLHSQTVLKFLEHPPERLSVSALTMIEFASMASRSVRSRRISELDAHEALHRAAQWVTRKCERGEVEPVDYATAEEFVRRFDLGLRAPDALHVAICRRLGLTLLTCDVAQAKAARELGVETIELGGSS